MKTIVKSIAIIAIIAAAILASTAATFAQEQLTPEQIDSIWAARMDSIQRLFNLDEITVKAEMPKTRIQADAIVTRVKGSVLERAGSAEDAIAQVPGMTRRQGRLEVIGKGAPVYYINGRKVRDERELSRLQSSDIKEVEVVTHPGAQYEAGTNAVVRIRTNVREGEGFGFSIDTKEEFCPRYLNNRFDGNINLSYRFKNLDFYGGFGGGDQRLGHFDSDIKQELYEDEYSFVQQANSTYKQHYAGINYHAGIDWQVNENHTLGLRMERQDNLLGHTDLLTVDSVWKDGALQDVLTSELYGEEDGINSWLAQAYYSGHAGALCIDFNLDYYNTNQRTKNNTGEQSLVEERNIVYTNGRTDGNMAAAKLVFTYPFKTGILKTGTEFSWLARTNKYFAEGADIPADTSRIGETNASVFAEYGFFIPGAGVLNVGLRYEYTDYRYRGFFEDQQEEWREPQHHVYPTVNFSGAFGEVQTTVSYAMRNKRPFFHQLSGNVDYVNKYTLSSGNPELLNEIKHQAGINARWRFLAGSLNYECQLNGIYDWAFPTEEDGQIMMYWLNIPQPIHRLSAFVNARPTIGIWQPNYTLGIQKQWFTASELDDPREAEGVRDVRYNKPMIIFNAYNAFVFPSRKGGPWQMEVNSELLSGGHWGNAELIGTSWNLSVALQKSWLKNDALSVRLQMSDLFHTYSQQVRLDMGNYIYTQDRLNGESRSLYDKQALSLSVRYRFNAEKKARKVGAGEDIKSRF